MTRVTRWTTAIAVALTAIQAGDALALQVKVPGRFDAQVIEDPSATVDVVTTPVGSLPAADGLRRGWQSFRAAHGAGWAVYLDRRSGAPLLAEGPGIAFELGANPTVDSVAASVRTFAAANRALLLADDSELILDRDASGEITPGVWQIVFSRAIAGVAVAGERYGFHIGRGNLMAFGAPRWSRIQADPAPGITSSEAIDAVASYMRLDAADVTSLEGKPELSLIATRSAAPGPYTGPVGGGHGSALVWRVVLRVEGDSGTWVALVDAHDGTIRAFVDDTRYAQVKGGVYPVSDDQVCPDGCEQQNFPMPYALVSINGQFVTTSSTGQFTCAPNGTTASTSLAGDYVRVNDLCGPISMAVSCDADIDLKSSGGIDCTVPAGTSAGNTHAARSSFYHLNRIAEHGRVWLPTRTWLQVQLGDNVNLNQTCNAYWNGGSVNFFKSGGGCNNTGEIAGVFLHEWGHGLDQNDGGGFDNPSEAYADIISILSTHVSCMGRGFRQASNCGGYGNGCLACTGVRDVDWNQRVARAPSTPAGFVANNCPGGSGPCGREEHCEGYVGGETLWDLAVRDLPASGLDQATAWQLADKLWYKSRLGSGGNAYNCSLPSSDGCSSFSWYTKLRVIDDDDGNLANGTPHAAAIFAAFDRHKIACGTASDPANQNSSSCAAFGAPSLTAAPGSASAQLTWTAVAGATGYNVLRNDMGCSAGSTVIATIPGTTYTDGQLANGFTEYYRVQAVGLNQACDGPVSNCQSATPQPYAGTIKLDAGAYNCSSSVLVTVTDGNALGGSVPVTLASASEPGGETFNLARVAPGSAVFTGTVALVVSPAAADGQLSIAHGDTIAATYVDGDDGQGQILNRQTTALIDCAPPVITKVNASLIAGTSARIGWTTSEPASSLVRYGTTPPPAGSTSVSTRVIDHAVDLAELAECTTYAFSVESTDAVANTSLDNAAGSYYTFKTGKNIPFDFAATDTPIVIPDNDPAGIGSTLNVTAMKTVQDVNVHLNLTHTFDGELTLRLVAPNGVVVPLAVNRGGSGNGFTNTTFDDDSGPSIGAGFPPYTGSFRPESPLSVLDGINAAGAWRLEVVDAGPDDFGTLDNWDLILTYPSTSCGPHAAYQSHALVTDTCSTGGAANANGIWDAGEQIQFKITVVNDGPVNLTGMTATVTPTTPGVVMVDGVASFPATVKPGLTGTTLSPYLTAQLPASSACGDLLSFQLTLTANEGSWSGTFEQRLGQALGATGSALTEGFNAGIPAGWSVVDAGVGGGTASTWTAANPGVRTIAPPMLVPVMTVDSDRAGSAASQDESLITPPINLAGAPSVTLHFDQYFNWSPGGQNELADVDVRSSVTGGAWVNVLRQQGVSSANPDHRAVDVSAQAAGAADAQIRFRDSNGSNEWWWQVDNVRVDTADYDGCAMPACNGSIAGSARPVASMTASRGSSDGSTVALAWDVATCSSTDHHLLYGPLASVASYAVSGSVCDLGPTGAASWHGVPAESLWFVIVGDDDAHTESSWGRDSSGAERGGVTPSGRCGAATRNNSGTCP